MLEQFLRNYSTWEGPTSEKFGKDCTLLVGPQAGAGKGHEEEGVGEMKHFKLTTTPISHRSVLLKVGGGRKVRSEVEPRKKGGVGGRWFEFFIYFSLSHSD